MYFHPHRRQTGFTLIEALVAIVIISIGLLGLIGLQTASLNNTQVSANSSQASIAAESMASRMRANRKGVKNGDYDRLQTDSIASSPNCHNSQCTPQQVAIYDLIQWKQALNYSLPNAVGSIKRIKGSASTPPYRFRITISWRPHHAKGYQNAASIKNSNPATRCSNAHQHCLTQRVTL